MPNAQISDLSVAYFDVNISGAMYAGVPPGGNGTNVVFGSGWESPKSAILILQKVRRNRMGKRCATIKGKLQKKEKLVI